jgi:hypothetical protein
LSHLVHLIFLADEPVPSRLPQTCALLLVPVQPSPLRRPQLFDG